MHESEIKRCKEEIKEDEDMLQEAFKKFQEEYGVLSQ